MYKTLALVPFLLLGGRVVEAKPCLTCTPDVCYQVAHNTDVPGQNPKEDCSAFMRTTVTPSARYATVTVTAVQTLGVTDSFTDTEIGTATQTDTATDTTAETSVATVVSEITETNTVAVTITETATRTTTGTETTTIVITSTEVPFFDPKDMKRSNVVDNPDLRRALGSLGKDLPPLRALPGRDSRRGLPISIISASAAAAVSVPAYAAGVCADDKAFSSACRCNGVRSTTITAEVPVTTLTVTDSEQVTQTTQANSTVSLATTVTQIRTVVVTEVVSQTLTVPVTSTIDQTNIDTALETTTTGVIQTTATTVTTVVPPGPTSGFLRAVGSRFDGNYVSISNSRLVTFKGRQDATYLNIDYYGILHDGGYYAINDNVNTSLLKFRGGGDSDFPNSYFVACVSGSGTGKLTCNRLRGDDVTGQVYFQQCDSEVNGQSDGVFVSSQKTLEGCTNFEFVLEGS
ncbi:hypothetical protein PG997_014687 [Apiospora hydei]|uniref:Uncharacterized protein n=1 Tax=Apiospora hydei TaxID=1337664 RepID=A0ABR1UUL5_9PEZI